jgi:hypothetical protein
MGLFVFGFLLLMFFLKIVIPFVMNGNPISPKILSCSVEEAKNVAAEHALNQLGISSTVLSLSKDFFNQTPNHMSYQGRTQHNQNLITTTGTSQSLLSATTPVPSSTPVSRQPEYMPLVAAPYFFDPTSSYYIEHL